MSEREPLTPECIGSQTVGPYYAIGLEYLVSETLAPQHAEGRHISITGTLYDANGDPVPDAILELWQASPQGTYNTEPIAANGTEPQAFAGFARLSTHDEGRFRVHTVVPGPVPFTDGRMQAPHIVVLIFMRGLMRHLVTRIYFGGEPLNANDPVLLSIPASRRDSLMATPISEDGEQLRWDIHLRGENETVFFAC